MTVPGPRAVPTPSTRSLCLAAIRDLGEATVSDIANLTGLSRPTVETALAQLTETGAVELADLPVQHRGGGRPARLSRFRADRGLVAGLDIVGPTVEVVVTDLAGRQVAASSGQHPSPRSATPDPGLVRAALHATMDDAGLDRSLLRAVGVGMAGIVQPDGTALTAGITPWMGTNVADLLRETLGVPLTLDNDLSLAGLAESRLGALADARVGVYVQTWHHVSARVTIHGEVLRGRHHRAGEVGLLHSFSDIDIPRGEFAVAWRPVDAALDRLRSDPADAVGREALERICAAMTPAVAALVLSVDPDVVVLGGLLGRHADLISPVLTPLVNNFSDGIDLDVLITRSDLAGRAVAVGATLQAFEDFSEDVYDNAGVVPPELQLLDDGPRQDRRPA